MYKNVKVPYMGASGCRPMTRITVRVFRIKVSTNFVLMQRIAHKRISGSPITDNFQYYFACRSNDFVIGDLLIRLRAIRCMGH